MFHLFFLFCFNRLERLGGTFNSIVVSWVVSPPTGDVVGPATSGTVRFNDGSDATFLNMSIIADNLPELEESFTVSLVAVLSGGASLSPMDTVANITVPANDDTNGVISVAGSSMMVSKRVVNGFQVLDMCHWILSSV